MKYQKWLIRFVSFNEYWGWQFQLKDYSWGKRSKENCFVDRNNSFSLLFTILCVWDYILKSLLIIFKILAKEISAYTFSKSEFSFTFHLPDYQGPVVGSFQKSWEEIVLVNFSHLLASSLVMIYVCEGSKLIFSLLSVNSYLIINLKLKNTTFHHAQV